jgi:type I restriction enzyme S subunit
MTAGTQIANDKTLRFFQTDFTGLARSEILRFSTRYHNLPTRKLMDILDVIETVKVKDIVLEAIHRGASPVYSENGLIPVVKTGHLKNGYIEISQEEFVEDKFYKSSIRSQIRNGDILIASTGKVSLGKIDLVETEEELVADGHLSIIRVDEKKCNRLFLV